MKIICFSATASFTAGAILLSVGAIAIHRAQKSDFAYAAIPLLFGIQQIIEGALWLTLAERSSSQQCLTVGYLGFANILWPIYVPFAIWLMEPNAAHRNRLLLPLFAGVVTATFFTNAIATHPISAKIQQSHISYRLPHDNEEIMFAFYATATCLAPLLSSYKSVRLLGLVIIASMIVAYFFYTIWFASVWCYFAALISMIILLHFQSRHSAIIPSYRKSADLDF